jgi:predicted 3-demethylubiquinone-9 3-methyltransferase (glyoxalase superfamily)
MQKITPSLWFDNQCEEAMNYYVSIFSESPNNNNNSRIISIKRYEEGMDVPGTPQMIGKVLTGIFELNGQRFMALDGGPVFKFNEAISFFIECENQEEVDYFWEKLSAVPEFEQCGWVKDKYGISWQIIPRILGELVSDSNSKKANRIVNAMLKMKKIDIKSLQSAYDQE